MNARMEGDAESNWSKTSESRAIKREREGGEGYSLFRIGFWV